MSTSHDSRYCLSTSGHVAFVACTCQVHLHGPWPSGVCCPGLQVTPSPIPNSWRLRDVFIVGIVYGLYLTLSTWLLYHVRLTAHFQNVPQPLHCCWKGFPSHVCFVSLS